MYCNVVSITGKETFFFEKKPDKGREKLEAGSSLFILISILSNFFAYNKMIVFGKRK